VFDWFSYTSDTHIGEYVSYGAEYHGVKWDYGRESKTIGPPWTLKGAPRPIGGRIRRYVDGALLDEQALRRSGEEAVPIICDMELDRERRHDAVNTLNTEGYIENLPRNGCIEVPGMCDGRGIRPLKVGPIPEGPAAIMRAQLAIHRCVTDAYRTGDKNLLLQALLLDPMVNSIENAKKLLDDMLERQAEYLPKFDRGRAF
jgi:alpha-galactosidase